MMTTLLIFVKKTLPGSFLLHLQVTNKEVRAPGHVDYRLDLISLALKGKKVSIWKVINMIDNMVVLLKKEQGDDDDKKEMCEKQLDQAEDDLKFVDTTMADFEKDMDDTKESVATLTDKISALKTEIEELDKMVEEATVATVNRKEENKLIGMAKKRMNTFCNFSMGEHHPSALTEEERITLNMGGTLAPFYVWWWLRCRSNPPATVMSMCVCGCVCVCVCVCV